MQTFFCEDVVTMSLITVPVVGNFLGCDDSLQECSTLCDVMMQIPRTSAVTSQKKLDLT